MNILFQPHSDDCCLFSSFNAIRYHTLVVTVLTSVKQNVNGITHAERATEDVHALTILGCDVVQWPQPDVNPDFGAVQRMMEHLRDSEQIKHVFAPAREPENGHKHHDAIADLADLVFDNVTHYLTYTREKGKSIWGNEVPYERPWLALKLQALACYTTQINLFPHHFIEQQREYVAP